MSASRLYEPKTSKARRAFDRATMRVNRIESRIHSMNYSDAGDTAQSGVDTTPMPQSRQNFRTDASHGGASPNVRLTDNGSVPGKAEEGFQAQITIQQSHKATGHSGRMQTIESPPRLVPKIGVGLVHDKGVSNEELTLS